MQTNVRWACLLAILVAVGSASAAAEVEHYAGRVELRPAINQLSADIRITLIARDQPLTEVTFYLNRAFTLDQFDCPQCSGHSFDLSKTGAYLFMPKAAPLTVRFTHPLAAGKRLTLRLRYSGRIAREHPASMMTADWTELALYSGWFPCDPASTHYTFDIAVKTPRDYQVAGNAEVSGGNGSWRVRQSLPTSDMVIAASRDLRTRAVERDGLTIRFYYAKLEDSMLDRLSADVRGILADYTTWYGKPASGSLTLLLNPRTSGGGYVRPGFISFPFDPKQYAKALPGWAHEIAHLWWTGAPVTTWEDWLNEGFAEYSSWRFVRSAQGQAAFEAVLESARRDTAGKPPIWGISRQASDAYDVLYSKAALRLYELETTLGEAKFQAFLTALHGEHIKSTSGLLDRLEHDSSAEVRQGFERLLRQ